MQALVRMEHYTQTILLAGSPQERRLEITCVSMTFADKSPQRG